MGICELITLCQRGDSTALVNGDKRAGIARRALFNSYKEISGTFIKERNNGYNSVLV